MFPLNLQRNIVQLDKQISLLENECKNMEVEKKKKNFEPESSYYPCSKISSTMLKPSTVKIALKKNDNSKKSKKPTPPASARLQCTNSLPTCTKIRNAVGDSSSGKKTRMCGIKSSSPLCPCPGCSHSNSKKEQKSVKCACYNDEPPCDIDVIDGLNATKKDHIWHKEVLIPHCDGPIEVTVTQKLNSKKEISPTNLKSPNKKKTNLEHKVEKDSGGCKCCNKGPKWSDILCLDTSKKKVNDENCVKNEIIADESKTTNQPFNITSKKRSLENQLCEYHKNYSTIEEESFQAPVKLSSQSSKPEKQAEINNKKFEKETQCSLGNCGCGEPDKESKDQTKFLQFLVNQIQKAPKEELTKVSSDAEATHNFKEDFKYLSEEIKNIVTGSGDNQNNAGCIKAIKYFCENLIKEKTFLYQELQAKEKAITVLKKREEEYLSLIASLRSNLETIKGNSQEGVDALKEINLVKNKLKQQVKISEALKKNHRVLQSILEQCSLENDKLKTQIKIFKLEAKKHEFLLAGKQAEINRYKEEIQNFQRQISDHLATLKSNSEGIDIEKMIEAIVHQSQIFAQTEMDSVSEKDQKDLSKSQNILIHSSPNTTANSVVNSSWKQISSIHDRDQSKANSDVAIYLNDDSNEKDFFQLFEENSLSEFQSPKKLKKRSSVEKLPNKKDVKNSSSFTSCMSARDDSNSSDHKNSDRDSLISNEPLISFDDKSEEQMEKNSQVSFNKAQSNIDELLKNMKIKFSKEMFETSLPSCASEDFLYISQISSISQC